MAQVTDAGLGIEGPAPPRAGHKPRPYGDGFAPLTEDPFCKGGGPVLCISGRLFVHSQPHDSCVLPILVRKGCVDDETQTVLCRLLGVLWRDRTRGVSNLARDGALQTPVAAR